MTTFLSIASRLGLESVQDKVGNTVIRKPAHKGRESAPMALLQGHLDMVCEKNEGTVFNFDTDAIQVRRDGDWLKAEGTTLGADNGVGVAAALAVMESTDIAHGPLEFVFTIDEETGLTGAAEFPGGLLKSKYFLNLDNEEKDTICIGCAGGIKTTARRKITLQPAKGDSGWRIKVSGLRGGHSGVDIHQGRGNALRILGGTLQSVMAETAGGDRESHRRQRAECDTARGLGHHRARCCARAEAEIADRQARRRIQGRLSAASIPTSRSRWRRSSGHSRSSRRTTLRAQSILLASLHHGVIAMSPDVPGLVQDSTNLATVATKGDVVEIVTSQRSAIESSKLAAARMVATVCRLAGFETENTGSYPGWKPEPNSDIVKKLQSVHEEVFGHPAELIAMHAGLECGVIGEKYPGMQMVSFGPTIVGPHSPHEKVEISSVEGFWKYLKAVLEKI